MFRYAVHRPLPFAVEDVFDLVADVESYPEFVPGWISAQVIARSETSYGTEQTVRMRFLRQRFRTLTTLYPFEAIDITANHPPFRRLTISWRFRRQENGSFISLEFLCEMRSRPLQLLLSHFGPDDVEAMIASFERRARETLPRRA
ncbi:MAG: type II toxin-antitoxin system RatA family toxin [Rhodospirillaceae bacterium]|nr:type II toxin-antitoxin system RatA family toxin [Rhodospirillaceae bacterium]